VFKYNYRQIAVNIQSVENIDILNHQMFEHDNNEQDFPYQLCFLVVLCDISIFVKTKDFWERIDGKGPDVVNIALVRPFLGGIVQPTGRNSVKDRSH
jgi:hypothetical protein